ncbi:MAG: helix-turn-helix transcriptional regulator [Tissierellia bacterium]|nr:helix-turn-helix transcriptional regulator [Tissierellia bacterium]
MLSENIKTIRKSKGLSQEELAIQCHVVRQTVSKWERGLSVPDSEMLITLSEVFETPVYILLGENIQEKKADDLKAISEKLEVINLQLAQRKERRRKLLHGLFISLCIGTVILFSLLLKMGSPYLNWDYKSPETAVMGVGLHALEWLFVRLAPIVILGAALGTVFTKRKVS